MAKIDHLFDAVELAIDETVQDVRRRPTPPPEVTHIHHHEPERRTPEIRPEPDWADVFTEIDPVDLAELIADGDELAIEVYEALEALVVPE